MNAAGSELARLLQLASPALPVGAYSYSQGLEAAVEAGIVRDRQTAELWIVDVLNYSVARLEAPILWRLIASWSDKDCTAAQRWNALFLAGRESAELRAETIQMGYSLYKLLTELNCEIDRRLESLALFKEVSFPAAFALAVVHWQIAAPSAVIAYLWAWLENQVVAAVKLVPLGQTDGQRVLFKLGDRLADVANSAAMIGDDELGCFAPRLSILSSRHEMQYSRLFRS